MKGGIIPVNKSDVKEVSMMAAKGALKVSGTLFLNSKIRDAERASARARKELERATLKVKEADAKLEKLKASKKPAEAKKAS